MTTLNGFRDRVAAGKEAEASQAEGTVPECPVCQGFGFYTVDVALDHPDFGAAFPCECRQRSHRRRTLEQIHALSYLEAVQNKTFSSFLQEPPGYGEAARASLREAHRVCSTFAGQPAGWILLAGNTGCGKTHLASAIANELAASQTPVLMLTVPSLLDRLRATFAPDVPHSFSEMYNLVESVDVLVLDDLGAQRSTPWATDKLFQLLNERHVRELPTVITTNLSLRDFEPRLQSRLRDVHLVNQVHIDAPDYRVWSSDPRGEMWADLDSLDLHQNETFSSFLQEPPGYSETARTSLLEAHRVCRAFADQPSGWIVLTGITGCGKTHLASAIANELADSETAVLMLTVPRLLDRLRATFAPDAPHSFSEMYNLVESVEVLVLDDLGAQNSTPWATEKLFQLLNERHVRELPTVVTTNLSLWEFEPRLQSRLGDMHLVNPVHIDAPDYRMWSSGPGVETWADLNSLDLHRAETFDTFDLRKAYGRDKQKRLRGLRLKLEQWLEQSRGWLVLSGPSGSGKTYCAAALANRWRNAGRHVLFVSIEDLKDYFRRTIQMDGAAAARRTTQIRQVSFLVLDGFSDTRESVRRGSGWTEKRIRSLLEYRFDAGLPTVITTHVEPELWEGWFHHRVLNGRKSFHILLEELP